MTIPILAPAVVDDDTDDDDNMNLSRWSIELLFAQAISMVALDRIDSTQQEAIRSEAVTKKGAG